MGEAQNKRYNKFKHLQFGEERAFQSGNYAIPGIQEELEKRGWSKLNSIIQHSNRSVAIELFANTFQTKKDTNPYVSFVCGKHVRFNPDTINTLLETPTPIGYGI
jgi:hypothetical protein